VAECSGKAAAHRLVGLAEAAGARPPRRCASSQCRRYSIVEVSAELRERQQALLAGEPVEWLTSAPVDFAGVMLANEVLDVMPVRLFVKRDGACSARRGVREHFRFERSAGGLLPSRDQA
jgi:SAM-dependent MidA family methyltransferase